MKSEPSGGLPSPGFESSATGAKPASASPLINALLNARAASATTSGVCGSAVGGVDRADVGIAGAEISGRGRHRDFDGTKNILRPRHEVRKIVKIDARARLASGQRERERRHRDAVANAATIEAATPQDAGPSTKTRGPRSPRRTRPRQSIAKLDAPSSTAPDTTRLPPDIRR